MKTQSGHRSIMAVLCVAGALVSSGASAQPVEPLVPFDAFLRDLEAAKPDTLLATAGAKVQRAADVEEMRQHLLGLYRGVHVSHSFQRDGQTVDCVPINEQPTVRAMKLTSVAKPPAIPLAPAEAASDPVTGQSIPLAVQGGETDARGNAMTCTPGSIPMRRVTLSETSRFATLHDFFAKGQGDAGQPAPTAAAASATHRFAHATEKIANFGINEYLNIWRPLVNTSLKQVWSLSQAWVINYNGTAVQTAEVGWQNYPQKWGLNRPVLFVYWTKDGYNNTGCYNLECSGFVQTNNSVVLGASFSNYSVDGGAQFVFKVTYRLLDGKWWVAYNGTWVGYYPASLYSPGKLANGSSLIDFGGDSLGTANWPPMGSGALAQAGYSHAAFHSSVGYYTNMTSSTPVRATLSPHQPSPKCFTVQLHNNSGTKMGSYFYFGGPGGSGC